MDKVLSDDELKKEDKNNQEKNIQSKIETTQTEMKRLKEELGIED
ncbi:hypothetical protein [Jeotgalibacillus soli]|nr:hypothetical protein [Jeotgalibacillus soli]